MDAQKNQNKGATTPKPVVTNKPETYLTPQEVALSKDFASNQGRLPWPVVKCAIVGYFGKHEHATIKGVFIENNGIDIKTQQVAEEFGVSATLIRRELAELRNGLQMNAQSGD